MTFPSQVFAYCIRNYEYAVLQSKQVQSHAAFLAGLNQRRSVARNDRVAGATPLFVDTQGSWFQVD